MKKIILISLVISSFAFAENKKAAPVTQTVTNAAVTQTVTNAAVTQNAPKEIKVGVKGMVCAFCAQGIEKKFKSFK